MIFVDARPFHTLIHCDVIARDVADDNPGLNWNRRRWLVEKIRSHA